MVRKNSEMPGRRQTLHRRKSTKSKALEQDLKELEKQYENLEQEMDQAYVQIENLQNILKDKDGQLLQSKNTLKLQGLSLTRYKGQIENLRKKDTIKEQEHKEQLEKLVKDKVRLRSRIEALQAIQNQPSNADTKSEKSGLTMN